MKHKPTIILIGAGNVATHLGLRLVECGFAITQVYSRTKERAEQLANQLNTQNTHQLQTIDTTADIYIFAIKDDAISSIAKQLQQYLPQTAIITHTSGATPSTVFKSFFSNYGVFYPLQTFSINRKSNFETLPMCIDGSNEMVKEKLLDIAKVICPNVYEIDDAQRAVLHVVAVIVNNFTNHLFAIGEDIANKEQIPFELLKPLITETVSKINEHPAKAMQTGPAIRQDTETINRHLAFLEAYPTYHKLYQYFTDSIQEFYK